MEDILESTARGFLRLIKSIVVNVVVDFFIHGVGYVTLKVVTFGKYPKPNQDNATLCICSGVGVLIFIIAVIALFNSK